VASFEREFSAAVESAERNVLIDLIRSRPEMSLADIGKLTKGRFSGLMTTVTIGDLIRGAVPGSARAAKNGTRNQGVSAGAVDTRTPSARKRYDDAVLRAVKASTSPVSAQDVRSRVGGTPLQARKALNRLIEGGRRAFQGKARATKYTAS
jgi:hypothetical protein